ncbi:MAG: phage holin family protein [Thermoleophilia bacterium]|jgi:uncharacterized membrane protein YvlD (DUF360 family)
MRFAQRFIANTVATFLALYLVDSVLHGRFVLRGVWAAVILALLLGFGNSLVRPLRRARTKPFTTALVTGLTVLINAFVMQVLTWAGAVSTTGFGWVLLTAAFVTLVTGTISWLIGFDGGSAPRPASTPTKKESATESRRRGSSSSRRAR